MAVMGKNEGVRRFTLVELLVSMGIFVLLLSLLLPFFSRTQAVWLKYERKDDMFSSARMAMELMMRTLQCSVAYADTLPMTISADEISFVAKTRQQLSDPAAADGVYLVNFSRDDNQLILRVSSGSNTLACIFRGYDPITTGAKLTSLPLSAASIWTGRQVIIPCVVGLAFGKLFPDGANPHNRPLGVSIALSLMSRDDFDKWQRMADGPGKDGFLKKKQYTFSRCVYFDAIGQRVL